ncbi:MAG: gamma carbonic anhydrase family protein [Syntrophales bacterium]|jgi:phenylacetic acid degradation protein|nr:gamma carbonic anhydrase family protein [Syntrophales bacterium]MCK9527108.1 gamma carbonic anhydrase family protein [Syntrophales bacterium]MDX9921767.1 gamma carbonic anhydrase family protein [Syntrophales bacterium]
MSVYSLQGEKPVISPGTFVHPHAVIIGDVTIGSGCFIAPGSVIRADFGPVVIGEGVNFQDNAVIHVNPGMSVVIEDNCTIGHGALLHDVHLEPGCVVGMGAVLLFGVHCEKECIVAAGSVVPTGMRVPAGAVVAGNPARIIKDSISREQVEHIREGAKLYQGLVRLYKETMQCLR